MKKKRRGRPPGSKNKKTLEREAEEQRVDRVRLLLQIGLPDRAVVIAVRHEPAAREIQHNEQRRNREHREEEIRRMAAGGVFFHTHPLLNI